MVCLFCFLKKNVKKKCGEKFTFPKIATPAPMKGFHIQDYEIQFGLCEILPTNFHIIFLLPKKLVAVDFLKKKMEKMYGNFSELKILSIVFEGLFMDPPTGD